MIERKTILAFALSFVFANNVYGAGVVARRKAMAEQQQQAIMQQRAQQEQQQLQQQAVIKQQVARQQTLKQQALQQRNMSADYVSPERYAFEEKVVGIKEVWREMEVSSEVWAQIMDYAPKEATVKMYIKWYKQNGTDIRKSPSAYVGIIDNLAEKNPNILYNSFKDILKIAAIIEYDFNNGMNKDKLARQVLGEAAYKQNKARLGR